jgi:hypothetical protein
MARRQRENANKQVSFNLNDSFALIMKTIRNFLILTQAEINKEILKSIGKRGGNSVNDDDIELYLKNRYYDTARLYAPMEKQQKKSKEKSTRLYDVKPQSNDNEKVIKMSSNKGTSNEHHLSAMNTPNQEKVYVLDDSSNNLIGDEGDDDDDTRLFFELFRNRLYKNF